MSRGVRDLRDLICVSRLSIRESDDDIFSEDDEITGFESMSASSDGGTDSKQNIPKQLGEGGVSPDSGIITNESPSEIVTQKSKQNVPLSKSQKRANKKKSRRKVLGTFPTRHDLPKSSPLPPVQPGPERGMSPPSCSIPEIPKPRLTQSNFDDMMCYMDATIVSGWLTKANDSVTELTTFCQTGDNYVQFAHFWLTDFPDLQKREIFEMEYAILLEEMTLAFSVGREQRKVLRSDITNLVTALYVEYPSRLLSSQGAHLFLDYLDVLSSERAEQYKHLLSNVRCCTRNRQYAQWLLATRSYALVSVWSAITNFYRNLTGNLAAVSEVPLPSSVCHLDVCHQRMYQAISLGYVDVLHYLLVRGHVTPEYTDSHGRTLIFTAVMLNQPVVVQYLLSRTNIDPNEPADTGNTPIHAAANSGHVALVQELLKCHQVKVNATNPQCENATPLHIAVMHGHKDVVEALVTAKADKCVKMGDLTPEDIARDFGKLEILEFLQS